MSKPIFISTHGEFFRKNNAFVDLVQGRMAMDVEVFIKTRSGTPVKTGGMKADVRHFKNRNGQWRVEAGKEYSAVQELGRRMSGKGAPTVPFKNYSTLGTSAGWFQRAVNMVVDNRVSYISQAKQALNL